MASISVSENGLSQWLPLAEGDNKVAITCGDWSGGSLALRLSHDGTNQSETKFRIAGDEVIVTENEEVIVTGPGHIGGRMSDYGGTPIALTAYPIRQPVSG